MWQRRVELGLLATVQAVFRHLHPAMAKLENQQCREWGEANKPRLMEELASSTANWRTGLHRRRPFRIADITALCAIDFLRPTRSPCRTTLRT